MARYIEESELIDGRVSNDPVVIAVKCAKTADVVEVIRCKDCIHGKPTRIDTVTGWVSDKRHCNRHYMCHSEDYYCADGKRKERGCE